MLFIPFIIAVVGAYLGFIYAGFIGGIVGFIAFGVMAQWVRGIATNNEYQDLPDVSLSPKPRPPEVSKVQKVTRDTLPASEPATSDEDYYKAALDEYEENEKVPETWAKALTICQGDEDKAKWKYIELRVEWLNGQDIVAQKKTLAERIEVNKIQVDREVANEAVKQTDTVPLSKRASKTLLQLAIYITTRLLLAMVLIVVFSVLLMFVFEAMGMNNLAPFIPIISIAMAILAIKVLLRGPHNTPTN